MRSSETARVLYLTYDGLTDPLGRSQVLPYLRGLSARGHQISIISFEKPQRNRDIQAVQHLCRQAGLDWHPLTYHKHPPVLSSFYDLRAMKRMATKLYRKKSFDVVHSRSYMPAAIGLQMKRRLGTAFLFDMRGFWADERVEGGLWPQSSFLYRLLYGRAKNLEQSLLRGADQIVSLTEAGKEELLSWPVLREAGDRICVIPCCVDFQHFRLPDPAQKPKARQMLGIPLDARVVVYLGSLGTWYMLSEMLDFYGCLRERDARAHFLLLTPDNPSLVLDQARRKGLDVGSFTIRSAGRSDVPVLLAAADFGIFFIKPVFSKTASSPTKLGELLSTGLPVVANSGVGDVARIVDESCAGVLVERFENVDYRAAIDSIDRPWAPSAIRENARAWFDLERGIDLYDSIYRRLGSTVLPTG